MNWNKYRVNPAQKFELSEIATASDKEYNKESLKSTLTKDIEEISKLQNKLFAENRQCLLIIFT